MADPFATGLSALHSTGASVAADYTPPEGAAVPLRVVHEQPSALAGDEVHGVIMDTHRFSIRRGDVALPEVAGIITVDPDGAAVEYRITGEPLLDTEGVSWSCPAEPV